MSDDAGAAPAESALPTAPHRRGLRTSVAIAAAVVVIDQLTKRWALNELQDRDIHLFWTLQLNLAFNTGMAFSRGQGFGPYIGVLALIVVVVMLVRLGRDGAVVSAVATGLIIGGAIGNIIDRLFRGDGFLQGAVIDFIDLGWFPIFNVADMGITIGGVLLVASALFGHRAVEA